MSFYVCHSKIKILCTASEYNLKESFNQKIKSRRQTEQTLFDVTHLGAEPRSWLMLISEMAPHGSLKLEILSNFGVGGCPIKRLLPKKIKK